MLDSYLMYVLYITDLHVYVLMRDAEGRKKEASKVIQKTRQSNTAHPRQSLKNELLGYIHVQTRRCALN